MLAEETRLLVGRTIELPCTIAHSICSRESCFGDPRARDVSYSNYARNKAAISARFITKLTPFKVIRFLLSRYALLIKRLGMYVNYVL